MYSAPVLPDAVAPYMVDASALWTKVSATSALTMRQACFIDLLPSQARTCGSNNNVADKKCNKILTMMWCTPAPSPNDCVIRGVLVFYRPLVRVPLQGNRVF